MFDARRQSGVELREWLRNFDGVAVEKPELDVARIKAEGVQELDPHFPNKNGYLMGKISLPDFFRFFDETNTNQLEAVVLLGH